MARPIDHVDMRDRVALALDQRGHEAVQRVEIWQREIDVATEHLQTAACVAGAVLAGCGPRTPLAMRDCQVLEGAVLATDPLPGRKTRFGTARLEGRDQSRNESRIVLPVAVEGRDDGAARGEDARAHRGALAATRVVTDDAQPRPRRAGFQELGRRSIGRAVVHIDHFEGRAAGAGALDLLQQREDVRALRS